MTCLIVSFLALIFWHSTAGDANSKYLTWKKCECPCLPPLGFFLPQGRASPSAGVGTIKQLTILLIVFSCISQWKRILVRGKQGKSVLVIRVQSSAVWKWGSAQAKVETRTQWSQEVHLTNKAMHLWVPLHPAGTLILLPMPTIIRISSLAFYMRLRLAAFGSCAWQAEP